MTTEDLNELFKRDPGKLKAEIEQYPADESLWEVADGISNSGGNLFAHLLGNLRFYSGCNLTNGGYVRNRDLEFSVKGFPKSALTAEIEQTQKAVSAAWDKLQTDKFNSTYEGDPFFENWAIGLVLLHLHAHPGYHLGQLNYHGRLI